jgi:hypothetical protein
MAHSPLAAASDDWQSYQPSLLITDVENRLPYGKS